MPLDQRRTTGVLSCIPELALELLRADSRDSGARAMAERAHQFREMRAAERHTIVLPRITSENREYLPVGLIGGQDVITSQSFGLFDEPIWLLSILTSQIHIAWIATVCGRDFEYSNTLGWNTFPVPTLTEKNRADLTRCAEDTLLAREHYFPAIIADMYDPDRMNEEFPLVREAHERNDEVLERIYIGRRFRNDTERLETLFGFYTKMTAPEQMADKGNKKA